MELAEKTTLSQLVCERLKQYITEHELKPGDRLPSAKQLTEMLKVSRTVVREALKSLESVGILRIRSGGGIYVEDASLKPLVDQVAFHWKSNKKKIRELLAVRKILELGAIELAIAHYDPALIKQMERAVDAMRERIAVGLVPIEEDLAFHRGLFKATGNQTFIELSAVLNDFFNEMNGIQTMEEEENVRSLEDHRQILDAICAKEVEKAKAIMTDHLQDLDDQLSDIVED